MPKRRHPTIDNEDSVQEGSSSTVHQQQAHLTGTAPRSPTENIKANDTNNSSIKSFESIQYDFPLAVGDDGYAEGSIVCITLQNFMTYDSCELYPGPQLNMIIGPNGTGKSSVMCALALGLGSHPSLLGRAKQVSEFIKAGESTASIQIELKKVHGQNIIIQRTINKDNKSTWKLDGRSTPYHSIKAIVNTLHIQVDNLCQFLPQDKVAEFARLEPPLLLMKTLDAVGKEDLKNQLKVLIDKQERQSNLKKVINDDVATCNTLHVKTELVMTDVDRLNERQQLANKTTLLEATIPLAKFSDTKKQLACAKKQEQLTLAEKSSLELEIASLESALKDLKAENDSHMRQRLISTTNVTDAQSQLRTITLSILKQIQETKQRSDAIKGIKNRMKSRYQDAKNMEEKIAELEAVVSVEPPTEDPKLDENIKLLSSNINEILLRTRNLKNTAEEYIQQKQEYQNKISEKKIEINHLQDISRIRLNILQRYNNDAFKAYMWCRENRALFRGQIFGPIQLSLTIRDTKYSDYVETALGSKAGSHLQTFVCEYAEDYRKLVAELVDHQGLRLTAAWPGDIDTSSIVKTPCTEQRVKLKDTFGLDHFVINLIDGPPLVLAYLCQQININCIPMGLEYVSIEKIVDESYFRNFIVAGSFYHVKKYTYGLGGTQTAVRPISRAAMLIDKVDCDACEQKHEELKQLEITMATIDTEIQALTTKSQEDIQKVNEAKHQRDDQKAMKRVLLEAHSRWEGQKKRLVRHKQDLELLMKQPEELQQEIEDLKVQIASKTKHRGQLVVDYLKSLKIYVAKVIQRNKFSLKGLSSSARYQQLKMYSKSRQIQVNDVVKKHQKAQQDIRLREAALQDARKNADQAGKGLSDELKEEFKKICTSMNTDDLDKTEEEIEDNISDLLARRNAITISNPLAESTYEKLLAEAKDLERKVKEDKDAMKIITTEISEIYEQWMTRLEHLVSQIDKKFATGLDRIGCAGQVAIGRGDSFQNWGIEIRVKFRDHEKLERLTGYRQSGGERAVSTILYLMALQNLARTPFRVVDEINQGMDPRNEKTIHEEIIRSASQSGTSQYFIITPKLLTDLYYDESMRILCIYNGEWQPSKIKPVALYLQEQKRTRTPV